MSSDPTEYIALREAARLLDASPSSVRLWADQSLIRTYRTPGGHRRFLRADVDELVRRRARGAQPTSLQLVTGSPPNVVLSWTRAELARTSATSQAWFRKPVSANREQHGLIGRRLLGLAISYLARRDGREAVLGEAAALGRAEGELAWSEGLTPADLASAVHSFRRAITAITRGRATGVPESEEDLRISDHLTEFLDVVLVAALDAYARAGAPPDARAAASDS